MNKLENVIKIVLVLSIILFSLLSLLLHVHNGHSIETLFPFFIYNLVISGILTFDYYLSNKLLLVRLINISLGVGVAVAIFKILDWPFEMVMFIWNRYLYFIIPSLLLSAIGFLGLRNPVIKRKR